MNTAARGLPLTRDVRDGLSELAVEELHYIVDGVRQQYAGAPSDAVVRALSAYQRVRQLDPAVVARLAETISLDTRPDERR